MSEELTRGREARVNSAVLRQFERTVPCPRLARMALHHQGYEHIWGIKSHQHLRVRRMWQTPSLWTATLIDEIATIAIIGPRSTAILRMTPTLSRPETGIMRPDLTWKETAVGKRHILTVATLRPHQVVKTHGRLFTKMFSTKGAIRDMSYAMLRDQTVRIRTSRLTARTTLRSTRGLRTKILASSKKTTD